mmetsp:Transcript_19786/g.60039  ORF Transcript_19786/g.60039 Transcript_19786/m.60039 type:complete len:238 (+) Transcript_19786:507-1220(+)
MDSARTWRDGARLTPSSPRAASTRTGPPRQRGSLLHKWMRSSRRRPRMGAQNGRRKRTQSSMRVCDSMASAGGRSPPSSPAAPTRPSVTAGAGLRRTTAVAPTGPTSRTRPPLSMTPRSPRIRAHPSCSRYHPRTRTRRPPRSSAAARAPSTCATSSRSRPPLPTGRRPTCSPTSKRRVRKAMRFAQNSRFWGRRTHSLSRAHVAPPRLTRPSAPSQLSPPSRPPPTRVSRTRMKRK